MCLSAACGAIGKDRCIVTVKDAVEKAAGGGFVHLSLRGILVKDTVEGECLVFDAFAIGDNASGELLDRVVLGRIEDPRPGQYSLASWTSMKGVCSQATVVNDLNNGPDPLLVQFGSRYASQ